MWLVEDLEAVADELYGLDPELFIPARTAAVAAAKAAGEKALAKQVSALRRPTRSAWLVNLLSRNYGADLDALPALAARLAEATAAVDVAALRAAGAERTTLVSRLTKVAVDQGRQAGYDGGESARAEVSTTLQAALADPQVLDAVMRGRVEKAQVYAGFGFPMLMASVPEPAEGSTVPVPDSAQAASSVPGDGGVTPAPAEKPSLDRLRAQAEVERLMEAAAEAAEHRTRAEEAAEVAFATLDRASQEVADLRADLAAAEATELAARDAARAASDEMHDARTAVQQADVALDRARRALEALP